MIENKLVVADKMWAEDIPKWILDEIKAERMINGMCEVIKPGTENVGNAEIVAYLFTASLRASLSSEHTKIYLKLSGELMKKRKMEIPEFTNVGDLDDWENKILEELRYNLKKARGKINIPLFEILKKLKGG